MTDLAMGIYRHYKGPLYQVLGLAHDANTDTLIDKSTYPWRDATDRVVVVYIPLQLDGAHLGPRMCVRTLEDFTAVVNVDGTPGPYRFGVDRVPRFKYLGPVLTKEML